MGPIHPQAISQFIKILLSRNLIQHDCHGSHIEKELLLNGGRHIYLEAAIYISRPQFMFRGRHLYLEADIYISRQPSVRGGGLGGGVKNT
jgi:hypothetical protein